LHTADGMTTYIYSKEVVLPVKITPAGTPKPAHIGAYVEWLACEEACIPGAKKLSLTLAATNAALPDTIAAAKIARSLALTPGSKATGTAAKQGKQITLRLANGPGQGAIFLPYDPGVLDYSARQSFQADGTVRLTASPYFNSKAAKRLRGIVLQRNAAQRPVEIDVPLQFTGDKQ
jgi:thiol:disulfide interchange protein DsbD